ncbi:MAG: PAS domain S-box protein [Bacteroidetes bacterium]|nr:PAS domain S-box protein [Bacteroidota bacterium]
MELKDLFNINFNEPCAILLSFIPAAINLFILIYISATLPQSRTTVTFSFFVLLLGLWQITDGFAHASNSTQNAVEWFRISGQPCLYTMPLGIIFILRFTEWDKKFSSIPISLFLFFPAIIFEMSTTARLGLYKITKSEQFKWIISPEPELITVITYTWICTMALLMLILLWVYYIKTKNNKRKQNQALLLLLGFSFPVIGGIVLEAILPLVFRVDSIPLTTALMTTFSVASLIAVKKYKLFDYSPKHQWSRIVEAINEGIVIVDNNDCIVYANKKYCEMVKYSYEELQGMHAHTLFTDATSTSQSNNEFLTKKDEAAGQRQAIMKTKYQETIHVLVSNAPYLDRNGNTMGSIGIHMEITQLTETQQKLKDKIKEINLFFYKTSHDLKTPVCSMNGLLAYYDECDNPQETVNYMKQCAQKLSAILDRISQVPDLHEENIFIEKINIEKKIETILKEIKETRGETGNIKIKTNTGGIIMESEKYPIQLILKNIIDNAVLFYDPAKSNPHVNISVYKGRKYYKIKVSDNGQGMSTEARKKAFEMFYKGTDKSTGEGLGLYIVKNAVERLQGKITLNSRINTGTVVVVYIPIPPSATNKMKYAIPENIEPSNLTLFPI